MAYIRRTGIAGILSPQFSFTAPDLTDKLLDMQQTIARHLDREADAELAMGHHAAAERLAWRAAEMRERGA